MTDELSDDINERVTMALLHLGECSKVEWAAQEDAAFFIRCLYEQGYEIVPKTDATLN